MSGRRKINLVRVVASFSCVESERIDKDEDKHHIAILDIALVNQVTR